MDIWYILCYVGIFFPFWYAALKKSGNPAENTKCNGYYPGALSAYCRWSCESEENLDSSVRVPSG
jgi:hypothetical protein